jgi:hypothetical protein
MRKWVWTTLLFVPLAFAGDFWKEKPPSEWSDKDVKKLLTNSPWAKQASVDLPRRTGNTSIGSPMPRDPGDTRTGTIEPGGIPVGGGRGTGVDPTGGQSGSPYPGGVETGPNTPPIPKVTVRWDSAQPLREVVQKDQSAAKPANLQDISGEFYVITVVGFPITSQGTAQQIGEELKKETVLKPGGEGKITISPAKVELAQIPEGVRATFLFPRSDKIGPEDKEVSFESNSGAIRIRTKFKLNEMMYQDKLAI